MMPMAAADETVDTAIHPGESGKPTTTKVIEPTAQLKLPRDRLAEWTTTVWNERSTLSSASTGRGTRAQKKELTVRAGERH